MCFCLNLCGFGRFSNEEYLEGPYLESIDTAVLQAAVASSRGQDGSYSVEVVLQYRKELKRRMEKDLKAPPLERHESAGGGAASDTDGAEGSKMRAIKRALSAKQAVSCRCGGRRRVCRPPARTLLSPRPTAHPPPPP